MTRSRGVGAFPDDGRTVFRPRMPWRISTSVAGLVLPVFGIWLESVIDGFWGYALLVAAIILGLNIAVRAWFARVSFNADAVQVRGVNYTRVIARDRILSLTLDRAPTIDWATKRGWPIFTPMTVLNYQSSPLPRSWFARSIEYLERLSQWAGSN